MAVPGMTLRAAKRLVLGLAAIAVAIVAIVFAWQLYRHLNDEGDPQPGIIFERTDRPSRV